jgi:hypothetical protein
MNDLGKLKKAIFDLHGCNSAHAASISVHETFEGKTVWQGVVEIFSLVNHPKPKHAYAWSYKNDAGEVRHVAVLGVSPINSAYDAVRAYIVSESQKQSKPS